jgi:hypothetical protein
LHPNFGAFPNMVLIPENGITIRRMKHEPIIETLRRNLRSVPPSEWEQIAQECGIAKTLPRKIAYGDRPNPGVMTIQPLVDWFARKHAPALTQQAVTATES